MLRFMLIRLLKWSLFLLLIGRAWQHFFWSAPYEYILPASWGPDGVDRFTHLMGWFYVLGTAATVFSDSRNKGRIFIWQGGALMVLAWLYQIEAGAYWPSFFVHSLQFSLPFGYYLLLFSKKPVQKIVWRMKMALSLSLLAYAFYALDIHAPNQINWQEALQDSFGLSYGSSRLILQIMGGVELALIPLLWFKPSQKAAFWGIFAWGILIMISSIGLLFWELPYWKSMLRSTWELLCLTPNLAFSYVLWRYVVFRQKYEDF